MATVYSPVAVILGDITLPADGDAMTAASVNTPIEAVADGVAYCESRIDAVTGITAPVSFTSGTTEWTAGTHDRRVLLQMCGGGGGGGHGRAGGTTTSHRSSSGGGGGGAVLVWAVVDVTPGTVYEVLVGAGGAGGVPVIDGSSGEDSVFREKVGPVVKATAKGAGGGVGGMVRTASGSPYPVSPGGAPTYKAPTWFNAFSTMHRSGTSPQHGGDGVSNEESSRVGMPSVQGYSGGANGTTGSDSGGYPGGGGGGGGGAGPFAAGGAGGAGGAGSSTTAVAGTNGVSAPANSGAGGGGGGAGGAGGTSGGASSTGGAGGSGFVKLWVIG